MRSLLRPHILVFLALSCPLASHAAIYAGFGDSVAGADAPAGWTRINANGGATSTITENSYFSMVAGGKDRNTLSLFDTGDAISHDAGYGFKLTATFTTSSGTGQHENTSFFFMSPSTGTNSPRVNFNMGSGNAGSLEFSNMTSTSNQSMGADVYYALEAQNALYTFMLTGIFQADGSLSLTATVTNDATADTVTSTATLAAASAEGNFFGLRTAAGGTGSGHSASALHQSYVLEAIPEPSAALLALSGAIGLLARRRRASV